MPNLSGLATTGYERIAQQLSLRTGIVVSRTPDDFIRALQRTLDKVQLRTLEDLAEQLALGRCWDELLSEVTIGETYFFRSPEHFELIRNTIAPGLRPRHEAGRPVRAWSAGCASGEEAYSLAIVLHETGLLEDACVLGSDISVAALGKAREARYREWAFRAVDAAFIARYFDGSATARTLTARVRDRVTFTQLNLATDLYPSLANGTCDMDLIMCRNVLIYFDAATIARVARQLFDALAPGGWLIAGPSDPLLAEHAPFEVVLPGEGVCYRRPALGVIRRPSAAPAWRAPSPADASRATSQERSVQISSARLAAVSATTPSTNDSSSNPLDPAAQIEAARARPNDLELAIRAVQDTWNARDSLAAQRECREAIALHPMSPELRYLQAVALLDCGKLSEALVAARQALYLDRTLSIAHFTLGSILERLHDVDGARRAYRNAYDSSRAQQPDDLVRLSDGIAAAGLASAAARALAALPGAEHL